MFWTTIMPDIVFSDANLNYFPYKVMAKYSYHKSIPVLPVIFKQLKLLSIGQFQLSISKKLIFLKAYKISREEFMQLHASNCSYRSLGFQRVTVYTSRFVIAPLKFN